MALNITHGHMDTETCQKPQNCDLSCKNNTQAVMGRGVMFQCSGVHLHHQCYYEYVCCSECVCVCSMERAFIQANFKSYHRRHQKCRDSLVVFFKVELLVLPVNDGHTPTEIYNHHNFLALVVRYKILTVVIWQRGTKSFYF